MFWTKCEVADLKQRQRTTAMDHRNKIQSLVLPTQMALETPRTALQNMARVPVNMAVCAIQHRLSWIWPSWCGWNGGIVCQLRNMTNSAETAESTLVVHQKKSKNKTIFEKVRSFSALHEGNCQMAWLFAYWGPFGRQRRAWSHEADPPHFHMHIGRIGQCFEVWVFP